MKNICYKKGNGVAGAGNPLMSTIPVLRRQHQPWGDRKGKEQPLNLRSFHSSRGDETEMHTATSLSLSFLTHEMGIINQNLLCLPLNHQSSLPASPRGWTGPSELGDKVCELPRPDRSVVRECPAHSSPSASPSPLGSSPLPSCSAPGTLASSSSFAL